MHHVEGLALARPVVEQGQLELLARWIQDGKLRPSEELADVVRERDAAAAIKIYKVLTLSLPLP